MFEFLFGPRNPTRSWSAYAGDGLVFDLRLAALNGKALGEPLSLLSFLGPDEDRGSFRRGELRYYSLGLCIECFTDQRDTITGFQLVFHDPLEPRYRPFAGQFLHRGHKLDLAPLTEKELIRHFGEPEHLEREADGISLEYPFEDYGWLIELDPESGLKRFCATRAIAR